jgi:chromosomal replication initiator protein
MTYFSVPGITERLNIDHIKRIVCDYYHITIDDLAKNSKKQEYCLPRQIAHYLTKKYTNEHLATIGNAIGNKDHATVIHSCRTICNIIETDKRFRTQIEEIERRIKA